MTLQVQQHEPNGTEMGLRLTLPAILRMSVAVLEGGALMMYIVQSVYSSHHTLMMEAGTSKTLDFCSKMIWLIA
jgi:hypothetical protein